MKKIKDREHFIALMEKIDRELSGSDLKMHQRPAHAFMKLTDYVNPKGTFEMTRSKMRDENDFTDNALHEQVQRWYSNRYGDRLKIHPGPGSYMLMIKGEPWKVEFPLCYGNICFTIDDDLSDKDRYKVNPDGSRIPQINILSQVEHITEEIVKSLSNDEKADILKDYIFGLNALQSLRDFHDMPYLEQAMNDYDTAVNNIFYKYPDYNNSKWSSLQFTEKTLKCKLKKSNISIKKTHDLLKLSQSLSPLGIMVSDTLISEIQCSAGVRYGEVKVTKQEAISALKCSLGVFSLVFKPSAYQMNSS